MINSSYFYNKEALNSSPDFALKYAGAISNTVLHPLCPSLESLYAALAYATKTLDVNSGLESNFKLYSMICLFSFSHPVHPPVSYTHLTLPTILRV